MASSYRMAVLRADDGSVAASWLPGSPVEIDFIQDCINRIVAKGVGVFRTEAHVADDIKSGIEEAIRALKYRAEPI